MSEILRLSNLKLNYGPIAAIKGIELTVEEGQMSIHMERLMRNHQQKTAFDSTRILLLNPYHPLIIKLADLIFEKDNIDDVKNASMLILEQAKIAEGEAVSNPQLFNEKLSEFILKAI